jgi:NAD(P)H-flavin reductase/hemoglobin-like flavoprotein
MTTMARRPDLQAASTDSASANGRTESATTVTEQRKSLPWWRLRTWRKDLDALTKLRDGLMALDAQEEYESETEGAEAANGQTANGKVVPEPSAQDAGPGDGKPEADKADLGQASDSVPASDGPDPAIVAIRETFALVADAGDDAAAYFYARLFLRHRELRDLFPPAMDEQRDRLFRSLARIVESLTDPEEMARYLAQLGRDHRKYGVDPAMYDAVGEALIATLRAFAEAKFTPAAEEAWAQTYAAGSALMIRAAEDDASATPAYWTAEVVGVDQRGNGIAVITVAPDEVLPYLAGQHLTLQTKRWPRVWRPYSIACKPRDDGLISLHVKAVPGGWVSSALVHHTKPGDEVILGPALGTMTLQPAQNRDLLCVAGGTGLSPIKAIIEQVVRDSGARPRKVFLFYGARRRSELYDMRDLWRLTDAYGGLQLTPVTSDDPAFDGMQGNVGRVAARYLPHSECEAYVAGPADMVRDSIRAIKRAGIPRHRIHYDDTLLAARPRVGSGT